MFLVLQPINSDISFKKRPMLIWLHKQYCSLRKDIRNIYLSIMFFFTNSLKHGMLLPFILYFTMLNITLVNKYITTQFEHFVVPISFFQDGKIGKRIFNIWEQQCLQEE